MDSSQNTNSSSSAPSQKPNLRVYAGSCKGIKPSREQVFTSYSDHSGSLRKLQDLKNIEFITDLDSAEAGDPPQSVGQAASLASPIVTAA